MSILKAVSATCLLLFTLSGFAQDAVPEEAPQSSLQVGLQVGMGQFLPFETGGARQGGRNRISQINIETHDREAGFRFAGALVKGLRHGFSFVQELGAQQSTNIYSFAFQGLNNGTDYSSGNGTANVKSTYLQSLTGLQFGTQGRLKVGAQVGLEINVRLAERTMATIDPGDPDAQDSESLDDFPDIVTSILSREAFMGAAGAAYAGYSFGKHEVRVQARSSVSWLSSQKGALNAQWFPKVSSLSLVYLINLH